jgi:CheY-like chemotaxis protein
VRSGPILVVEDDAELRRDTCEALEEAGYVTLAAADGADAMRLLRTVSLMPSLILLDLEMAGVDGYQFRTWQRATEPFRQVPVIVVSGVPELDQIASALEVEGGISKPVKPDTIIAEAKRFVAG